MGNYLNAFYGAANAMCQLMTSKTYVDEVGAERLVERNNKILAPGGVTYHLGGGATVQLSATTSTEHYSRYSETGATMYDLRIFLKGHSSVCLRGFGQCYSSAWTNSACASVFNQCVSQGGVDVSECPFLTRTVTIPGAITSNPTVSELVDWEGKRAKGTAGGGAASVNSITAWQNRIQAANAELSNIKGQAQAGVSQANGWVSTDADNLNAASNMLAGVLQSLASPLTVSG